VVAPPVRFFKRIADIDRKIDNALVQWGMPMGPLRLIDEIGVDVTIDIGNTLEKAYGRRDHVSAVLVWLRDGQMLGRRPEPVFYKYEGKAQTRNDSLSQWRRALHGEPEGAESPNIPRKLSGLNETGLGAPACLPDGQRSRALRRRESRRFAGRRGLRNDLGTGFAPFRGGPLRYAEHCGLREVVDELDLLARSEEKFSPCEILRKHASEGTKFYTE